MEKKVTKKKSPIKLLEESIKYWEQEHEKMDDDYTPEHDITTCPLCVEYNNEDTEDNSCEECPIQLKVDKPGCSETPFDLWVRDRDNTIKHQAMIDWMKLLHYELTTGIKNKPKIKEPEKTYETGNRFILDSEKDTYILAQIDPNVCILIGLDDGNRWSDSVSVKNVTAITQVELKKLAGKTGKPELIK